MKLIGCMAVRNEAWCLGLTLRAALQWCDEMVVLLHACTDESLQIVADIQSETGDRISYFREDGEWDEMRHRQKMLTGAREEHGATHIAIVDADELVTGNLISRATKPVWNPEDCGGPRDIIERKLPPGHILQLPMYQLRGSLDRYHANGIWGNRWLSVAFQDDPRLSWSGDKFHSREPQGMTLKPYRPIAHGQGGSFHLWGVSERRLRAKHALYKVTERLRWKTKPADAIDKLYNLWRDPAATKALYGYPEEPWTFADVPAEWWEPYRNNEGIMTLFDKSDSEPWQEAEVRRLLAQHGADTFKGLDLFGVV